MRQTHGTCLRVLLAFGLDTLKLHAISTVKDYVTSLKAKCAWRRRRNAILREHKAQVDDQTFKGDQQSPGANASISRYAVSVKPRLVSFQVLVSLLSNRIQRLSEAGLVMISVVKTTARLSASAQTHRRL